MSGLLSSAGGNLTTLWTGATTNGWFPSSPNHSAIPHSAGQLPLPLPTAALPNFSSWLKGPTQFLPCLGLLSQGLFSFKEQLQAIKPALHSASFTPQTLHMLNQHLFPLFSEAEDLYLSLSRIILLTVLIPSQAPEFLPDLTPDISLSSHLHHLSHSPSSFALASKPASLTHL